MVSTSSRARTKQTVAFRGTLFLYFFCFYNKMAYVCTDLSLPAYTNTNFNTVHKFRLLEKQKKKRKKRITMKMGFVGLQPIEEIQRNVERRANEWIWTKVLLLWSSAYTILREQRWQKRRRSGKNMEMRLKRINETKTVSSFVASAVDGDVNER